ncbi:hypothetical protein NP493_137g02001 [Ridgeia piscesae]|uniref:Uncharacterized protein n=1 Tax=Ridgeia piscesae TaxID=27915 RepID=A0AAD9P524_RIDPI|nr:hypothetical protein NP493_137g02001 [Ridgeia piscesae]
MATVPGGYSPSHSQYVTVNSLPATRGGATVHDDFRFGSRDVPGGNGGGWTSGERNATASAAAFPMSHYASVFAPTFLAAVPTPEQSPSSRSLPPVTFSLDPPSPIMPPSLGGATSGSFASSLSRDPTSDILLQEISRLRERLHSMETENAAMALKLNHQQWEVDHRLSEIEMQICGSDSAGSGSDDRSSIVPNKESVI